MDTTGNPPNELPFTVKVFDADGSEIPVSGRHCTEPDCQRPIPDGFICPVCHDRLKLVAEANALRLELITRNDEIAALMLALRDVTAEMWGNVDADEVILHVGMDAVHVSKKTAKAYWVAADLLAKHGGDK